MDLSQYYRNPIALCSFLTVLYLTVFVSWGVSLNPRARTNQAFVFMCLHALAWQLGLGFVSRSERAVESGVVSLRDRKGKPVPISCNVSAIRDW